jgi:hypothetical protein
MAAIKVNPLSFRRARDFKYLPAQKKEPDESGSHEL